MPVARADLELLLHFAHRAAVDKYMSDTSSEKDAGHSDGSVGLTTRRICGFRSRDERYMAMHTKRRDHQGILLLPVKKRKWMRYCDL